MKLSEIETSWKDDSLINDTALDQELLKIPNLHQKYMEIYNQELLSLKRLYSENKRTIKTKTVYYSGKMSEEELADLGWEQFRIKLVKGSIPDIKTYLDADEDLLLMEEKIEYQKVKVSYLESIIKTLNNRGYNIRAAIDFLKFTMGQ